MTVLPTPIAAVTVAALQAELTHWLVAPTTIDCPAFTAGYEEPGCCDGTGRVPLVVNVGDRVTVPISDELPAEATRHGDVLVTYLLICARCGASASLPLGMTCADHRPVRVWGVEHLDDPDSFTLLVPGGSLSGTVAAIPDTTTAALPIVAHSCFMQSDVAKVGECVNVGSPGYHARRAVLWTHAGPKTITAELPWQDFTPGMQAFRLTDVTVTP